jgi:hypothetical protein
MGTKILHLLKGVYTKHLGIEGMTKEEIICADIEFPPIDYDYNDCIYDDWPVYDEEKLGPISPPWDLSLLFYPKYCMAWIEWYFSPMLDSIERDRKNNVPLTKSSIGNYAAHLPYEGNVKRGVEKWPKAVCEASKIVCKILYEWAVDEGTLDDYMSFEDFLKFINSDDYIIKRSRYRKVIV